MHPQQVRIGNEFTNATRALLDPVQKVQNIFVVMIKTQLLHFFHLVWLNGFI